MQDYMDAPLQAAKSLTASDLNTVLEKTAQQVSSLVEPSILERATALATSRSLGYFLGGATVGAYFGYRIGAVSGRAREYVENTEWMRAAAVNSYDGIQGIRVQEVEVPKVVYDEDVLIEVKAASLDPVDIKVSQGYGRGLRDLVNKYNPNTASSSFPVILGRDGTGIVREVGRGVHNLAPGDRVWFVVPPCHQGSLSTYTILPSDYIRILPASLTFETGATLPHTGLMAWDLLVKSGGLGPYPASVGKKVFIWGGVRAVERLCVQLCRVWGCQVTCIAPLYTHDYLRSLGASVLLDDDSQTVKDLLKSDIRYDVVVNTSGLVAEELCLALSTPDGRVVTTLTSTPGLQEYGLFTSMMARMLNSIFYVFKSNLWGVDKMWLETEYNGRILDYLGDLVNNNKIDPVGERIFNLEQTELAFKSLAGGGHKGKLVIRMEQESSLTPWRSI